MQNNAKEALEHSTLLKSVLTGISDGIVIADASGNVLFLNPAAERITGCNPGTSLPLEQWSEFFGCYHTDGTTRYRWDEVPIIRAIRGEEIIDEELLLRNENFPQARWLNVSGRPLDPSTGIAHGAVVVFRDITDKKNAELELRRSNEELQQFAYIAAHDLQEPLRTITGFLDLLSKKYQDGLDEKANRYINNATEGAKRLQHLVGDLLIYSRVSSKPQAFVETDCNAVVQSVINDLAAAFESTSAQITYEQLPLVHADRSQLRQLFQNLISNALKYRGVEPLTVEITCQKQGINWLFTVADNGIGFEMEFAERIFLIFQRLHGRTAYPGTGIGLALCRRIVERHKGRIWATSEPNNGAQFHFTIPISGLSHGEEKND